MAQKPLPSPIPMVPTIRQYPEPSPISNTNTGTSQYGSMAGTVWMLQTAATNNTAARTATITGNAVHPQPWLHVTHDAEAPVGATAEAANNNIQQLFQ